MKHGLLAIAVCGCVVTGDAGALTAGSTGTDDLTSVSATQTADDADTGDKLDVSAPDVEAMECESIMQSTTIVEGPSDILVVVDRAMDSDSTDATFLNFSQLIANDGIEDVQVLMLAGYPPEGVCIDEPPLGIGGCPLADHNPPMYQRIEQVIDGDTVLSQILDAAPQWTSTLRPEARKHIFIVTSTNPSMDADAFDAAFVALDPANEGYVLHAIAPASACNPGWAPATTLETLTATTGGVFEDGCDYNVSLLFEQVLDRIEEVALSCEYDIPPPPDGQIFDKGKVNVDYDDGFGLQTVGFVEEPADCVSVTNGWFYDDPIVPERILMCPQTCARFEALQEASIDIRFGCTTIPAG